MNFMYYAKTIKDVAMHVTHGLKECEERETLWQCQGFKFYFRWYRHAGRYVCSLTAISILVILADDAPWRQSYELTFFPYLPSPQTRHSVCNR